jgi:ATP-binding cassette subfamily B protein RaxB
LSARLQRLQIWFGTASTFLMGIEHVILVFVAAKMVLQAKFTIGMIFAFMSYRQSFSQKAIALVERIIEFRLLNLHLERISDIALEPQEDQGENEFSAPQEIKGNIEFRNVTFSYAPTEALVLDKINFSITVGETVAIVGKSGCGKTTLLKLATGLFKANQGDILIDGKELNEFGIANFRRQIGVVMQEDKLFSGSLADNIGFFDPEINMDLVLKCSKQAMIHDEIMQMPMKYESLIGDMGTALSGGQIQRVILARALYRKPKILFMDEGTAHLDVPTERAVIKSVAALGITRIIIAHRPETINSADRILSFENGKLTEKAKQKTGEKRIEIAEDKTQTSSLNNCRKPAVNFTTDNLQASQPIKSGWHSNRLEKYTLFQSNSNLKKD